MQARRLGPLLLFLLCVLAGCGGSGGSGPHDDPVRFLPDRWPTTAGTLSTLRTGCDVLSDDALPGGDFTVALTAAVDPAHAPVPHNRAERVVFAQLYETLVNVACDGTAQPGLAASWTCTADSTTWVFSLREDARFWDGTRITAEDVRQAWTRNQSDLLPAGAISPWNWINARDRGITAVDARRLAIQLPEPQARFPLLLAHPAAAVAIRQPGWAWPVGSGPCRLRATDPAPLPDLICRPNQHHPHPPVWKSLTFRVTPGLDPRDLVATDIDLALARDLATVAFYDEAPGFQTVPLPWERLYLLVCPPQLNPAGPSRWSEAARQLQVTRDVTAVAARPWHDVMFPAGGGGRCPQLSGPITGQSAAPLDSELAAHRLDGLTIAYPQTDPGAVELAGRLSHLAGADTRIAGLIPTDLDLALQWQMAGAFVVAQDQIFPTGCLQLAALMGRTAWLQKAGLARPDAGPVENLVQAQDLSAGAAGSPSIELARTGIVHPLALSHRWLIVRGELAGLSLDFDGTPLLAGLGRPVAPQVSP
jgi:hypothetical protein